MARALDLIKTIITPRPRRPSQVWWLDGWLQAVIVTAFLAGLVWWQLPPPYDTHGEPILFQILSQLWGQVR
ncbi:MAG: hypothetical protein ABIO70_23300 [Pseudomonadota bacterium]